MRADRSRAFECRLPLETTRFAQRSLQTPFQPSAPAFPAPSGDNPFVRLPPHILYAL